MAKLIKVTILGDSSGYKKEGLEKLINVSRIIAVTPNNEKKIKEINSNIKYLDFSDSEGEIIEIYNVHEKIEDILKLSNL